MSVEPDFVIHMEVDEVSKLHEGERFSEVIYFKDLPWKLLVDHFRKLAVFLNGPEDEYRELSVHLNCANESETTWSCEASIDIVIINEKAENNREESSKHKFDSANTAGGCGDLIAWNDLIDPEKGFVKDDSVTIEARVIINKATGGRKMNPIDYTKPVFGHSNVILKVEGAKFHVSKEILSIHSPVFSSKLFGDFVEKNKEEIELEDVDFEEFEELLNMIYPTMMDV
ncbi:hypothetical protein PFISCL1PPCAC_21278, partial [Pristionchus fissidentatus]